MNKQKWLVLPRLLCFCWLPVRQKPLRPKHRQRAEAAEGNETRLHKTMTRRRRLRKYRRGQQLPSTSADLGEGSVQTRSQLSRSHISTVPKMNRTYAFRFKYVGRDFIKYQISYVSCTPQVDVNYWQNAYVN